MKRIIIAKLMVLLLLSVAGAQTRSDVCHVYVVDVAQARKAAESFRETGSAEADAKALSNRSDRLSRVPSGEGRGRTHNQDISLARK